MKAICNLANSGADFAALSANTPHIVFDRLKEQSPIPLVSIIEATRDEAVRQNKKKIGLLGTIFTMTGEFLKIPFYNSGITIVVPTDEVSPVPCLDTMKIHIETLIDRIVK
ncbi:MAG: aspartate/glutamate racemase family protein [Lachnospiraceae bacterium]|nr:aspartate/glutamate racemase family protein [Lachnospiraceae bacterium]